MWSHCSGHAASGSVRKEPRLFLELLPLLWAVCGGEVCVRYVMFQLSVWARTEWKDRARCWTCSSPDFSGGRTYGKHTNNQCGKFLARGSIVSLNPPQSRTHVVYKLFYQGTRCVDCLNGKNVFWIWQFHLIPLLFTKLNTCGTVVSEIRFNQAHYSCVSVLRQNLKNNSAANKQNLVQGHPVLYMCEVEP